VRREAARGAERRGCVRLLTTVDYPFNRGFEDVADLRNGLT